MTTVKSKDKKIKYKIGDKSYASVREIADSYKVSRGSVYGYIRRNVPLPSGEIIRKELVVNQDLQE